MLELKNVLVATDFSEVADEALRYGRTLARQFGATLHVLHVAQSLMANAVSGETYVNSGQFAEVQKQIDESARKRITELVIDNDPDAPAVSAVVLTSDRPAETILKYAAEYQIDLIVTGTQGRGFLSRLMVGSVAERVVRLAPCPVLTVHHPEREFVKPDALTTIGAA
jgi:nucleotide-binding universal stress UspA family protein